jgi:hypothetical protein
VASGGVAADWVAASSGGVATVWNSAVLIGPVIALSLQLGAMWRASQQKRPPRESVRALLADLCNFDRIPLALRLRRSPTPTLSSGGIVVGASAIANPAAVADGYATEPPV